MRVGKCKVKPNSAHKIKKAFESGRGKKFNFKFITDDKVIVFKKGVECFITATELNDYFEIIK